MYGRQTCTSRLDGWHLLHSASYYIPVKRTTNIVLMTKLQVDLTSESFFLNCPNIRGNGSLTPLDFPEKILCARPSYEKNICKILGPYFDCSSRYWVLLWRKSSQLLCRVFWATTFRQQYLKKYWRYELKILYAHCQCLRLYDF